MAWTHPESTASKSRTSDALVIQLPSSSLKKSTVESIVKRYQQVERDAANGEILAGGNTYVFCQYGDGIFDEVILPFMAKAEEVFFSSKYDGRTIAKNDETEVHLVKVDDKAKSLIIYDNAGKRIADKNCLIREAKELALAMWRNKNIRI